MESNLAAKNLDRLEQSDNVRHSFHVLLAGLRQFNCFRPVRVWSGLAAQVLDEGGDTRGPLIGNGKPRSMDMRGDRVGALAAYRNALQVAEAAAGQSSLEALSAVAVAHQGVAWALSACGQWDGALAEQRASVAMFQRQVRSTPPIVRRSGRWSAPTRRSPKFTTGRGDYRAAVAEAEKGRPFLESDRATHPEDNTTQLELRALLEKLRVEYLHDAEFEHSLAAAREVVDIVRQTGELSRARALTALADTLLRMGRRDEALNTFREASAVLDRLQVATFPSLYYRNETVAGYLGIVEGLTSGRREEDAAQLLDRLTPVTEALVHDYPGNGLYRNTLVRAYRAASEAHSGMGDAERALEFTRKAQMLATKAAGPEDR